MWFRPCVLAFVAASVFLLRPGSVLGQDCPSCVTLARQGATADTVSFAASAYRAAFSLTNRGADSATYNVACVGVGAAACVTPERPIRLAPAQQFALTVDYRATRAGRGLVVVRVRDPRSGARASAALLLTVVGS